MRFLIVSQYFYPENFKINDLVLSLIDRGHQVSVLTGQPSYPDRQKFLNYDASQKPHKEVEVYRCSHFSRGQGRGLNLILNYLSFAISACWTGHKKVSGSYDRVFVFEPSPLTVMLPGLLMAKKFRAPLSLWVQDLWPETLLSLVPPLRILSSPIRAFCRWMHRQADEILIQSEAYREPLVGAGVDAKRIHFFPNWAESFYVPKKTRDQKSRRRLMFTGNLGVAQGLDVLIDAVALVPKQKRFECVIVGDGRIRAELERKIVSLELQADFIFMGAKPAEQIPELIGSADFCYLSLARTEISALTIPSKMQTYMACGAALIASGEGELASHIARSCAGVCVEAGDVSALALLLEKIFDSSDLEIEKMQKNSRNYYLKNFSKDQVLNSWLKEAACASSF